MISLPAAELGAGSADTLLPSRDQAGRLNDEHDQVFERGAAED